MAQIKFNRGLYDTCVEKSKSDANGIYFATDKGVILLNNVEYGVNSEYKEKLNKAINSIAYDTSTHIITFKTVDETTAYQLKLVNADKDVDGLMSAADKVILDTLNGEVTVEGSVKKQIKDAVDALDVASVGGAGKVITSISETDGKISAEATDLIAANVGATEIAASTTTVAVEGADVAAQIASIGKSIKEVAKGAATYSVKKVTESLATNVKEAYQLTQTIDDETTDVGVQIPVYKDSSLYKAYLGHTDDTVNESTGETTSGSGNDALCFVYYTVEGKYTITNIDVADFLRESEFGKGLKVTDGVVDVVISDNSKTITTGENESLEPIKVPLLNAADDAIEVADVLAAIDYAVGKVKKEAISVEAGNGISITTVDTKNTVSAKIDVASEQVTTAASTSVDVITLGADGIKVANVQKAIDYSKSIIDAYTINEKAISTNPVLDGADIKLTGYTVPTGGSLVATDTVNAAFNKLDDALVWHEA